jgi:hypothetical protein
MVSLAELKKYVDGYQERQKLLEVAFRFSKLGERAKILPAPAAELYSDTHFFIYETIMEGYRTGHARKVAVEMFEDDIPVSDEPDCDEYTPEISCAIYLLDDDDYEVYSDTGYFSRPLQLNLNPYRGFVEESCEKTSRTATMRIPIGHFSLDTFAKYAYLIGSGMPLDEAISSRRAEIQKKYCKMQ